MCNTYCFSTTTVVARMPLNVTLYVPFLPFLFFFSATPCFLFNKEVKKTALRETYDLYSSPNIVRVIKTKGICRAVMWRTRGTGELPTGFWWGNLRKIYHLEYIGLDGKARLECTFHNWNGDAWTGFIWPSGQPL